VTVPENAHRAEADEALVFFERNLWELHAPNWERRIRALMNRVRELEAALLARQQEDRDGQSQEPLADGPHTVTDESIGPHTVTDESIGPESGSG